MCIRDSAESVMSHVGSRSDCSNTRKVLANLAWVSAKPNFLAKQIWFWLRQLLAKKGERGRLNPVKMEFVSAAKEHVLTWKKECLHPPTITILVYKYSIDATVAVCYITVPCGFCN